LLLPAACLMPLPHDPFNRSRLPVGFDRADRVRLIAEAAEALLEGRMPDPAARLFLGGALRAWLTDGGRVGDLERRYLKVTQRERSTLTPQRLFARSARTATPDGELGTMSETLGEQDDDSDD